MDTMSSRAVIEKLAKQKLATGKCLLDNERYDDAYYLAGYSIELYLKAAICKNLGIDNFFTWGSLSKVENYRVFKSHNYEDLLVLSGLDPALSAAVEIEPHIGENWTTVKKWNESSRYDCDRAPSEVMKFIKSSEIICSWIQKHL